MQLKIIGIVLTAFAVAASAMAGSASAAGIISYNFEHYGAVGGAGIGSGPHSGEFAGVVSADYWYNSFPDFPTIDLVDDDGNATTMDIGWFSANGSWSTAGFVHPGQDPNATGTWNMELLNGYLNSGGGPVVGLDLKEIPYDAYQVYVYFNADVAGREGEITGKERDNEVDPFINDTKYYFSTNADITGFTQTTDTVDDPVDTAANYAVFSGTLDYFNVETYIFDFGGIAGFQIVGVPEPATFGLGALLMGLGLLQRRRHW